LIYAFDESFYNVNYFLGTREFFWLRNYIDVIVDPDFWGAMSRTLYFTAFLTVLGTLIGLGYALLLNEKFRGCGLLRGILIIPWAIPPVVDALLWTWIYHSQLGALNGLLYQLGLIRDYITFLSGGLWALTAIGVAFLWQGASFAGLLFLASMQAIPREQYEASEVDGANTLQRFWYITLPWLKPMMAIVLVLFTLYGFLLFDHIYVMTAGGPGKSTTVLSWYIFTVTFTYYRIGKGTAASFILAGICVILAYLYVKLIYRKVV
jgi:ABC-type sugar transport system permease subunit